jgi:murein DD-endopeptidase MepM/ murein hydrolase activator NlpD
LRKKAEFPGAFYINGGKIYTFIISHWENNKPNLTTQITDYCMPVILSLIIVTHFLNPPMAIVADSSRIITQGKYHRINATTDTNCPKPVSLNSNLARLRWPFSSGSWTQRNNWYGGAEPTGDYTAGWGRNLHQGSHYYAVDWSKRFVDGKCDSAFYAPIGGTVILARANCPHSCTSGNASCPGNEVVILSNIDTTYAFSVLHLNAVSVNVGTIVNTGDLLGYIGSTGYSIEPHAHCVLFRNTDRFLTGISVTNTSPDIHATPYEFSAECGGNGPYNITMGPITAVPDIEFEKYYSVFPNPVRDILTIVPRSSVNNRYQLSLFTSTGLNLINKNFTAKAFINLSAYPSGQYILLVKTNERLLSKRIIVIQ